MILRWPQSIRLQLPLALLLLGAVVMLATLWFALDRVTRGVWLRREATAAATIQVLVRQLDRALERGEDARLDEIATAASELPDLLGVFLVAPDGRLLASSASAARGHTLGATPWAGAAAVVLRAQDGQSVAFERRPDQLLYVAAPLSAPARAATILLVSDARGLVGNARGEVMRHYGASSLLTLAALVVMAWFLHVRVSRPALRLARASDRLAAGDPGARTGLAGRDELHRAGAAFDRMAQRIVDAERESETRRRFLDQLLAALPMGVIAVSRRDQRVVFVNPAWRELFGIPAAPGVPVEELFARLRLFRLDGTPMPTEHGAVPTALRTGAPASVADIVVERPDGTRMPLIARAFPISIAGDAGADAVIGINENRHEVARAFEELRRSERQLQALLEAVPVGVLMVRRADRAVLFSNRRFHELYGHAFRPGEPLVHMPAGVRVERVDGRPYTIGELTVPRVLETGRSAELTDAVIVHPDGTRMPVFVASSPASISGEHAFDAVVTVVQDRRDINRVFAEAEAWRERYEGVTEATQQVIYEWRHADDVCSFSPSLESVFGYRHDELPSNAAWNAIVHPDDLDRTAREFEGSVRERKVFDCEHRLRHRDGRWRWVRDRGVTRVDEQGRPVFTIGAVADVTEQRELELQLRHAQKLETLGTLTGGIAHDFNNQLTGVIGHLELLPQELDEPERALESVRVARLAAERCAALTRGLLAFSRKLPSQPRPTRVSDVLDETARLLRRVLPANVALELDVEPGLPAVYIDPNQLQQVLFNLCVNARDAMPQGGRLRLVTRRLGAGADRDPGVRPERVEIAVSDEGLGMTPEVKARIFEPFFTTKPQGVGLGLAMAYGIVTQHGGWLDVASEPGAGSTFRIALPAIAGPAPASAPAEAAEVGRATPRRVLVVDDEPVVRGYAVAALASAGWDALEAANGEEALRMLGQTGASVDLVLLDLTMPGLPSRAVVGLIREMAPETGILLTSGYAPDTALVGDLADLPFLQKPFRPAQLLAALDDALPAARRAGEPGRPARV